jgi:hypothetical protein
MSIQSVTYSIPTELNFFLAKLPQNEVGPFVTRAIYEALNNEKKRMPVISIEDDCLDIENYILNEK